MKTRVHRTCANIALFCWLYWLQNSSWWKMSEICPFFPNSNSPQNYMVQPQSLQCTVVMYYTIIDIFARLQTCGYKSFFKKSIKFSQNVWNWSLLANSKSPQNFMVQPKILKCNVVMQGYHSQVKIFSPDNSLTFPWHGNGFHWQKILIILWYRPSLYTNNFSYKTLNILLEHI